MNLPPKEFPGYSRWEDRVKALMIQVGMPESQSLATAFKQLVNEMMQAQREAVAAAVPEFKQALAVAICCLFNSDPQDVTNAFTNSELEQVLDITEKLKPESVEGVYRKAWDLLSASPEVKP